MSSLRAYYDEDSPKLLALKRHFEDILQIIEPDEREGFSEPLYVLQRRFWTLPRLSLIRCHFEIMMFKEDYSQMVIKDIDFIHCANIICCCFTKPMCLYPQRYITG